MSEKTELLERIIKEGVLTQADELVENHLSDGFWEDVENLYDEDDEPKEVYCWHIVSKWLHEKLSRSEAVVCKFAGLHFWGRTEFGQSLTYDYDLNQVAEALL